MHVSRRIKKRTVSREPLQRAIRNGEWEISFDVRIHAPQLQTPVFAEHAKAQPELEGADPVSILQHSTHTSNP